MKICSKCKQEKSSLFFSKDKYKKSGYRSACKECSALEFKKFQNSNGYIKRLKKQIATRKIEKQTDPISRWASMAIANAKRRAKQLGVEFKITKDWLMLNAVTHCPLLEVPLDYGSTISASKSASIDRKDSKKGYTPENCKIISFKANRIKSNATIEELNLFSKNLETYY
jgi:hypothetical protein